jgi:hypothetical protein
MGQLWAEKTDALGPRHRYLAFARFLRIALRCGGGGGGRPANAFFLFSRKRRDTLHSAMTFVLSVT